MVNHLWYYWTLFPYILADAEFQHSTVIRNMQNINNGQSLIIIMNDVFVKHLCFFCPLKCRFQRVIVDMFVLKPTHLITPQPQVLSATRNSAFWVQWLVLSFISSQPWRRTLVPAVLIFHGRPEVTVHRQVCGWHPRISHHHEKKTQLSRIQSFHL